VLPNPIIIFSAGAVLSLALGLLFVLVLDHLEDTIVSLQDIEGRLALKVLAVLPHIRRKKREQVAKFIAENKYSQFAEAMAGLRNLLDSPRYQPVSKVLLLMSTQPGEGKTITSCSLAISSAQAGKRTLLVDFDLRRPRLARVWGLKIDLDHSFSHYLSRKDGARDFASLVMASGIEHLDVVASLPPDNVNPASVMGSQGGPDFFMWARLAAVRHRRRRDDARLPRGLRDDHVLPGPYALQADSARGAVARRIRRHGDRHRRQRR